MLTFGVAFALYFASSGVESLRIGLNRAYDMVETRSWWLLRIESIGYVIVGAVALLAFAFLVVLAPFIWYKLVQYVPTLEPLSGIVTFTRYATAAVVIVIALTILHLWLPAGRRTLPRDRARHHRHAVAVAGQRRRLRPLSRRIRLRLCDRCMPAWRRR